MKKILLGSLFAAIVWFIWGLLAHTLLPLNTMGLKPLPHESSIGFVLELGLDEPGLYAFPWRPDYAKLSREAYANWQQAYQEGPVGLLLFHPKGLPLGSTSYVLQFFSYLLATSTMALLLAAIRLSFMGRLVFVLGAGMLSWLSQGLPYWMSWGFPWAFVLASAIELWIGWFLAGLVLAAAISPSQGQSTAKT